MQRFKTLLLALVILFSLVLAQPSLADRPKFLKNPDYIQVTKALDELLTTKDEQVQSDQPIPKEIQQKIDQLEFKKYTLETGKNWSQCTNETGKNLAIYGPIPDSDNYENYAYDNVLYFLADGQTTKNKWNCEGVYLPNDAKLPSSILQALTPALATPEPTNVETKPVSVTKTQTSVATKSNSVATKPNSVATKPVSMTKTPTVNADTKSKEITTPVAVKIVQGTKLVVKANSETGELEFNVIPDQVFQPGEANWFIPNVSQAEIDTQVPNAKTVKS